MSSLDSSGDGQLDFDEFCEAFSDLARPKGDKVCYDSSDTAYHRLIVQSTENIAFHRPEHRHAAGARLYSS